MEENEEIKQETVEEKPKSRFTTIKVTKESSLKFKEMAANKRVKMYELFDELVNK